MTTKNINDRLLVTVYGLRMDTAYDCSPMVLANMRVENLTHKFETEIECAEYVDNGIVNNTADSHMHVNGVYNATYRFRMAIVDRGETDPESMKDWMEVDKCLRSAMQSFVDDNMKQAA